MLCFFVTSVAHVGDVDCPPAVADGSRSNAGPRTGRGAGDTEQGQWQGTPDIRRWSSSAQPCSSIADGAGFAAGFDRRWSSEPKEQAHAEHPTAGSTLRGA